MGVNIEKVFGENVFDDSVMKVRLPKSDFERVKTLMHEGGEITEDLADVVAQALKEWALEKGATHYSHVFQPYVISVGAEKHDSFASVPVDGKIENTFTGKELLMENLMLLHSLQVDLEKHVKQEDIQHGTLHLLFTLKKIHFVYQQLFAHIQVNHLTQRHHFLRQCMQ